MKPVLIQKELAKHLKVSQMSVSRVVNNRPGVSPKLKHKVLEAVKKYGYVPNRIASGLAAKSTRIIGLIIPDVSNSFFPEITKSIEKKTKEGGYHVILAHSYESYSQECEEINLLLGFYVEGFIIAPAGNQSQIQIYRRLKRLKIPFVFIDRFKEKVGCSSIGTDIEKGAFLLGRYLLKKGYKRWGYLMGPKGISSSEEHSNGLKRSLRESGQSLNSIISVKAGFLEEGGYKAVKKLLNKGKPEVIISINDSVAIGAYRFLKEKGIKVPQDMALAGFSNLKSTDVLETPLTTVREPTSEIGKRAVEILLDKINNVGQKKERVKLEPELIIRDSA